MFCPNCGAPTEGKFCEKCGTAVDTGAAGSGFTKGTGVPPVFNAPGLTMNIAAALCYAVPLACPIIFIVVDPYKKDRDVRFAAFQSLFFSLCCFVFNRLILLIVFDESWRLSGLLNLAEWVALLFLAFKAFQKEKVVLPFIGPLAQKQV